MGRPGEPRSRINARERAARRAKAEVKAPRRMPRPEEEEIAEAVDNTLDGQHLSPLGIYLKVVAKVSLGAFARAMGVHQKTISEWATGKGMPLLPAAYEIERLTKGVVPVESWLGLPQAKAMIAKMRAQQPRVVAGATQRFVAPGGFASDTEFKKGKKR